MMWLHDKGAGICFFCIAFIFFYFLGLTSLRGLGFVHIPVVHV